MKSGPDHPTSGFVLSSEALSCLPVIESVFPKFIRAIMCFRPWVLYIVLLLSPKYSSGPETISLCILEGSPYAFRAEQSSGDSIWWHYLSFMEVDISGNSSDFLTVLWK